MEKEEAIKNLKIIFENSCRVIPDLVALGQSEKKIIDFIDDSLEVIKSKFQSVCSEFTDEEIEQIFMEEINNACQNIVREDKDLEDCINDMLKKIRNKFKPVHPDSQDDECR